MEKKVMSDYTLYCTEEQTKKALELCAPLNIEPYDNKHLVPQKCPKIIVKYPTAEQMINWLEERGIYINILWDDCIYGVTILNTDKGRINPLNRIFTSRKEATIVAIDKALEYLSNNKEKKGE